MGLFDFFRGKKRKEEKKTSTNLVQDVKEKEDPKQGIEEAKPCPIVEPTPDDVNKDFEEKDKKDSAIVFKDEKHGIEVRASIHEENTIFSEPYNEVKAYVEFMDKYSLIDAPETHSPNGYVYFQFLNAGLHGVPDVRKCHEELFSKGFYEECDSPMVFLTGMTVSELKDLAEELGLEVKGKKAAIQDAIAKVTTYEQLKSILGYGMYHPSKKADDYKKAHQIEIEYYFQLKDQSISMEDFAEARKTESLDDINFPSYKKAAKQDEFYFGTGEYEWIAEYYRKKGKLKKTAEFYLKVFLIELSGIQLNNVNWHEFKKYHVTQENWKFWNIDIDDDVVGKIHDLRDEIDETLLNKVAGTKLPFNACPPNLFNQIIELIKVDKFDETTKQKLSIALNENLKKIRKDLYGI